MREIRCALGRNDMSEPFGYGTLVYFGDSLTDDGNLHALTGAVASVNVPVDAAGYNQRFSNGLVYAEYATDLLGVSGDLNFGIGGARALGTLSLRDLAVGAGVEAFLTVPVTDPALDFDINLGAQIDRFLAQTEGQDRADMSATLFIGANDYLNFDPSSPDALVLEGLALMRDITDGVAAEAQRLVDAGVGQIVINGLPAGDYFPAVRTDPQLAPVAGVVLGLHNARLEDTVAALQAQGGDAVYIDIEAITRSIVDDPLTFGITAPFDEVVVLDDDPNAPVLNPVLEDVPLDNIAFFDVVHPTDTVHGVIGSFQAASLTSEVTIGGQLGGISLLGDGQDLVLAGGGTDILALNAGDDIAFGEAGADFLFGAAGADILSGGSGDDFLFGGDGDDVLAGGTGNDTLRGGLGNDVLIDGLGSDTGSGGLGNDLFIFTQASLAGGVDGVDTDSFDGGFGFDTLVLLLTEATAQSFEATSLSFGQSTALAEVGISVRSMEEVVVLTDAADLDAYNDVARLAEADLWALV
jgi:phospholipase/lecithinase/hemolysin